MPSAAAGSPSRKPKIGVPRLYAGNSVPVLYPGEVARAVIDPKLIMSALERGEHEIAVERWMVEPAPGPYMAFLRWKYRLVGWWWEPIAKALRRPLRPSLDVRLEGDPTIEVRDERSPRRVERP